MLQRKIKQDKGLEGNGSAVLNRVVGDEENTYRESKGNLRKASSNHKGGNGGTRGGGPCELQLESSVFGSFHARRGRKCFPGTRNCTCGGRGTKLA